MTKTYSVNGTGFNSFSEAIKAAQAANTNVIETANGKSRWSPDAPVSSKKLRAYREKLAAYQAYQRMTAAA